MPPIPRIDRVLRDILDNPGDRARNQSRQSVPPFIVQRELTRKIQAGPPPKPPKPTAPIVQVPVKAMEIQILDGDSPKPMTNLSVAELKESYRVVAQFNPEQIEHVIKVLWAEPKIPGLSHQPHYYLGTENRTMRFDLKWDALAMVTTMKGLPDAISRVLFARAWLDAITVPLEDGKDRKDAKPPRVLMFWPNYMSLTCHIHSVAFRDKEFAPDGHILAFDATVECKEVRDKRIFFKDKMAGKGKGALRPLPPSADTSTSTSGQTHAEIRAGGGGDLG